MLWAGIVIGLGAALAQSLSYLFTRLYVIRQPSAAFRLLVQGHLAMAVMSGAILPFCWPEVCPPVRQFIWPLVGACAFYLLGQLSMFITLRAAEASRISPLLGLKILILAVVTSLAMWLVPWLPIGKHLALGQWLAVGLSVWAALLLRAVGGHLPWRAMFWVLVSCILYSFSDLCIKALVESLREVGSTRAVFLGTCFTYILCGVMALAALPWSGAGQKGDLRWAIPWAVSWLGAMFLLYGCFFISGVVFGNILQSTRGLISVLLGVAVAKLGHLHVEQKLPRRILVRRVAAAMLMFAAICLYAWCNS